MSRRSLAYQAIARAAIAAELDLELLARVAAFRVVTTEARDKESHLGSPDAGARLSGASLAALVPEPAAVQIVVADGLSAAAVPHNVPDVLPVMLDGLVARGVSVGQPLAARYGRVKLAEPVAGALGARVVVMLIGERPGSGENASRSLSAYLVYRLEPGPEQRAAAEFSGHPDIGFEYTVISNIQPAGLPAVEAGGVIVSRVLDMLAHRAGGNRLEALGDASATGPVGPGT